MSKRSIICAGIDTGKRRLDVAQAITGADLIMLVVPSGLTLERLGVAGMSPADLLRLVQDGV